MGSGQGTLLFMKAAMSPVSRLFATSSLTHSADQLALAALPLTAIFVLGAGPATVGALVAAQTAAWLIVSLPMGVAVDRWSRRGLLLGALALSAATAILAIGAAMLAAPVLLGAAVFLAAAGTVTFVLIQIGLVPSLAPAGGLATTNARLELARATAVALAPFAAGSLAQSGSPLAAYVIAAGLATAALAMAATIPIPPRPAPADKPPVLTAILEGARFVRHQPLLRGIVLCAIFWNFAFVALLATFIPFALARIGADAASAGLAQGANGIGMILGAALAPVVIAASQPRVILVFGPAVSTLSALAILLSPGLGGLWLAALAFFMVGFGPMLWLVMQTTVRQTVTPGTMMGRVTATIQVAIYGVRPFGALAGGIIGQTVGLDAAMVLVVVAFGASAAAALFSGLARLGVMPEPVG